MKFSHGHCEVCGYDVLYEQDAIAFRRRGNGVIEPVSLAGQQPWSGVGVVCRSCARTLGMEAGLIRQRPLEPAEEAK